MSEFRTLPVEEAVAWIRAWTDHTWPITLQEALAIRDDLGWKPLPEDDHYFATELSVEGNWGGRISRSNELGIKGVSFDLSAPPSCELDEQNFQASRRAYSQYVTELKKLWGSGRPGKNDFNSPQHHWKLPNKVSISITLTEPLIGIDIDSPWRTQISEEYDRAMEDYE
ncbi:DUF6301 family protein [Actinomyces bowdenii]|uniref:Uncharacterized protein n=1 Tax=Actinomyces bowdenii TaxID=131109 RepID=A0A3P1V8Y6_9ACTO|nr:DUF6301 family protein [Actinomyces bowdenii]RRD30117.1 hypothetical protein EII10_03320 [Actinomyces bowdenii]